MSRAVALLAVVLLAGCAAGGDGEETAGAPAAQAPPPLWDLAAEACYTTAVFFLVEYHQADAFLPPAFRPRDLAAFLYYTPVTSGKVPAFVALSTCDSLRFDGPGDHAGKLEITYVGFFVEPPALGAAYADSAANFDFYTVAYLGPPQGATGVPFSVTDAYGWRNEDADISLVVRSEAALDVPPAPSGIAAPERLQALTTEGTLRQGGQPVFSFDATAFFPQTFQEAPTLRFWHEGPRGIGWMEFDLPMQTVPAGPLGACTIRAGSLVHEVLGHTGDAGLCGPTSSFALVFDRHGLVGQLHHLEGVTGAGGPPALPPPLPPARNATLRVHAPLDMAAVATVPLDQASVDADTFCHDGGRPSMPLSGWQRYDDPFIIHDGPSPYLRFRDDYQENGCGEARFPVAVPAGATTMTLSFQVDRQVESQTRLATPRAFQTLRLYAGDGADDPSLRLLECFGEQEVFPPSWPSTRRVQEFSTTYDLTRCGATLSELWDGRHLVVGFAFQDGGPMVTGGDEVPDGLPAGQLFRGSVYAPQVTFDGMRLPVEHSASAGLDPSREVVGYVSRGVDVPPALPGQHHEVSFSISNQHGILGLYKRTDEGLVRLRDSQIEAREVEGLLVFTISPQVIAAHGAGGYEVVFTAPDTGRVSILRLPLVAVALLLPLVAGAAAQRNLNHVHRLARGPPTVRRHLLQAALVAAWAVYIAVALFLFLADAGIGMAAWPVPPPNIIAYVVLAITAAAMVAVAVAARRLELALVRRDLSALEVAQRELERSNRELEQFAYVASHDLKEPLRIVAGYTQLLGARYGDRLDEKGRTFLGFASEGAGRLQRMVDDLLAYSRVRADPATVQPVPLEDAATVVRMHLKGLLEERGVDLRVGAMPTVMADRGQVVQLLLNLVQNAIKFSPQPNPVVEVSARRAGTEVMVSVRDEGIGIEPRQQERIFQIFQRLHLREEYEGNGIGLAVCRKIVEQFGGRIWVDSAPGRGSTFCFTLPAAPGGQRPSEARPTGAGRTTAAASTVRAAHAAGGPPAQARPRGADSPS